MELQNNYLQINFMISQVTSTLSLSQKQTRENNQSIKRLGITPLITKKSKAIMGLLEKAYKQIKHDQEVEDIDFINRISTNLDIEKVEKMLNNLAQGYIVIKHSKNTKQPHKKFLYLSQDRRYLCWKSIDKSDQKNIQLKTIEFIAQGKLIKQWRTSSTMKQRLKNCFIIISQMRNLQIECSNQKEAENLIEQIEEAAKNSKRMHLSYNF